MQLFPNLLQATVRIGGGGRSSKGKRDEDAEGAEGPTEARSGRVEGRGEVGVEYRKGGKTRQSNDEPKAGRVGVRNVGREGRGPGGEKEEVGRGRSELGAKERGVPTKLMRDEPGPGGEEPGSRPSIGGGGEVVEVENALDT